MSASATESEAKRQRTELFLGASVKTMGDSLAAKAAEKIPLHPEVADVETGQKKPINPATADPIVTQKWVLAMMQGKHSPLYAAFQPGAKGGKIEPSEREVTFEELLLRAADRSQQFPIRVHMHLKKHQRYLMKLWEMHMCDQRRATHRSQKSVNMLPEDIVEMQKLVILAIAGTDHHVEWQEFKPPAHPAEFPKKVSTLERPHFEAMDALRAAGVNQALDDVSIAMADAEFCPEGHPYTAALCSLPEIKRNIKQIKLDLKDGSVMYQEMPTLTNPAGQVAFKKCLQAKPEFIAHVKDASAKLMKDFGGHFTIEGSHQTKDGPFLDCDFQGCETNDWAEGMSAESSSKAFVAMTDFLNRARKESGVTSLVDELLETLKSWEAMTGSETSTTAS